MDIGRVVIINALKTNNMEQLKPLIKYYIENTVINSYYRYKGVVVDNITIDGHLCSIEFTGNEYSLSNEYLDHAVIIETRLNIWEMMAFLYNQSNENNG